jgi:hypothetical protein
MFGVTHCCGHSRIVILPDEYPINRVSNRELTSYLSRYLANTQYYKFQVDLVIKVCKSGMRAQHAEVTSTVSGANCS